jgi:hypothetical protein
MKPGSPFLVRFSLQIARKTLLAIPEPGQQKLAGRRNGSFSRRKPETDIRSLLYFAGNTNFAA